MLNRLPLMLDEGRLTNTDDGSRVDFTNTLIIMTANIGAEYLLTGISRKTSLDNARSKVMKEVTFVITR